MTGAADKRPSSEVFVPRSDVPFYVSFAAIGAAYIVLIVLMLAAEGSYTSCSKLLEKLSDRNLQYSMRLSLISSTITTILSLWVAVPIGYLMSRRVFRGKAAVDAVLDIPIVLPPLVIGLCLLILFQTPGGRAVERVFERITEFAFGRRIGITFEVPSIILAQFMVACAFAVRTMRVTFDQIHPRCEKVALTLGCNQSQAFWMVIFPQAHRGLLAAGTLAWARSLGEFGPVLIFSGATHMKTEVLPTTVFLEMQVGEIEGAAAASLIMVVAAMIVLILARVFGLKRMAI
jgi:molybdate transport system permease protein